MKKSDKALTLWNTTIYRRNGKSWAVAEVIENGKPTGKHWLAVNYDKEESYQPEWLSLPDGSPTVFTGAEINDFVARWLRQ